MLRSYSFTEHIGLNERLNDKTFFSLEKQLAAEFVRTNPTQFYSDKICPICGSKHSVLFCTISNVPFFRCNNCWSIFIPVSQEQVDKYRNYAPIKMLRSSEEYQEIARIKRDRFWQEICFWIQYRAARYLGKTTGYALADVGNRYTGLREQVKKLCSVYTDVDNIAQISLPQDIILYFNQIQFDTVTKSALANIHEKLVSGGLLMISARVANGLDILVLKGANDTIYPYEHTILPSVSGLHTLLEAVGFEVLEITSPGNLDIQYVLDNIDNMPDENLFIRYLSKLNNDGALAEFQRFLQKSNISSYSQIVARRKEE
jgi:hypothetical protein